MTSTPLDANPIEDVFAARLEAKTDHEEEEKARLRAFLLFLNERAETFRPAGLSDDAFQATCGYVYQSTFPMMRDTFQVASDITLRQDPKQHEFFLRFYEFAHMIKTTHFRQEDPEDEVDSWIDQM